MSPDIPAADPAPEGLSRRRLMRQAAAVGAAGLAATMVTGVGTGVGTGTAAAADNALADETHHAPTPDHDEPVIVHVCDVRSGHLDLFSGERHHRVQDPALAAALVRALA
ncbi:hypothetical protein [Kitasatospora sp. NPDC094011]|uniref:hypothetical protein n=1 Tax=Kitasatospora sp. NPDC094011 TaxID=3364090 RepID=UPI00381B4CA9